jgi:hypothetical protein
MALIPCEMGKTRGIKKKVKKEKMGHLKGKNLPYFINSLRF